MKLKKASELNYYELLSLPVTASRDDIEQAYLQITSIYSENSIPAYGAISTDDRAWMLNRVQEAYSILINAANRAKYDSETLGLSDEEKEKIRQRLENEEHGTRQFPGMVTEKMTPGHRGGVDGQYNGKNGSAPPIQLSSTRITGAHLRNVRVARGASLESIAEITKVQKVYLEAIEQEDTKSFPAPVFIKGFLKAYAKALGLDPVEISDRYLSKE